MGEEEEKEGTAFAEGRCHCERRWLKRREELVVTVPCGGHTKLRTETRAGKCKE